jgi:hypothetical protein
MARAFFKINDVRGMHNIFQKFDTINAKNYLSQVIPCCVSIQIGDILPPSALLSFSPS